MELHPPPRAGKAGGSGRRTLRGEVLFLASACRLLAILVFEYIYYVSYGVVFLFLRRSYREKIRGIVLGAPGARTAAVPLALFSGILLVAAGCSQQKLDEPVNSRSFKGQMRELGWSIHAMVDQSDSKRSLEEDLQSFRTEPDWKEDLRFSARGMFLMEDAKESMEFDLQAFGDPDHRTHGLKETIELLGF